MSGAYGTKHFLVCTQRIEIRCYKIFRAYGSVEYQQIKINAIIKIKNESAVAGQNPYKQVRPLMGRGLY